jgi:glucosamine-6-phosphate deaminase
MKELLIDQLKVKVYPDRTEMGTQAAKLMATRVNDLLGKQEMVNIIFAAAASQNEFLEALSKENVNWARVNAFHMDEYIGLAEDAPQQFGKFLQERIFDKVPFREVFYLKGYAEDIDAECKRYSDLLQKFRVDITCMGIGENAHLAFNDPHVANFNDEALVKVVDLDEACKQQQVNEGCFPAVEDVPVYALTLTIPALMNANYIFCMVPGPSKANAVYHTLNDDIKELYPSTILRKHPNAILFLDKDSAVRVLEQKPNTGILNYN